MGKKSEEFNPPLGLGVEQHIPEPLMDSLRNLPGKLHPGIGRDGDEPAFDASRVEDFRHRTLSHDRAGRRLGGSSPRLESESHSGR